MRYSVFAFAAVMLVFSSSVSPAESKEAERHVGGFSLYRNDDNCTIIASYTDGESVLVRYDGKTKDVNIAFTNKNATSLTENDEKKIKIYFVDGKKLDDGWGETSFSVSIENNGTRMLVSQPMDAQLLDDFAKNDAVGFFYGDKMIASYTLKGSGEAIPALKTCAMQVAGINPNDPFAQ